MQQDGHSAPRQIGRERINDCRSHGAVACREGRARNSSGLLPGVERNAFQEGWDAQQAYGIRRIQDRSRT